MEQMTPDTRETLNNLVKKFCSKFNGIGNKAVAVLEVKDELQRANFFRAAKKEIVEAAGIVKTLEFVWQPGKKFHELSKKILNQSFDKKCRQNKHALTYLWKCFCKWRAWIHMYSGSR